MEVTVSLFRDSCKASPAQLKAMYESYYQSGLICYRDEADPDGMLSAAALSGKDNMTLTVTGNI